MNRALAIALMALCCVALVGAFVTDAPVIGVVAVLGIVAAATEVA